MGELGASAERERGKDIYVASVFIASQINLGEAVTPPSVVCRGWIGSDSKTQVPASVCLSERDRASSDVSTNKPEQNTRGHQREH